MTQQATYPTSCVPPKLRNKSTSVLYSLFNSSYLQNHVKVESHFSEESTSSFGPEVIYKYPLHHKGWVIEQFDTLEVESTYMQDRKALAAAKKGDLSMIKPKTQRRAKLSAKEFISETITIQ